MKVVLHVTDGDKPFIDQQDVKIFHEVEGLEYFLANSNAGYEVPKGSTVWGVTVHGTGVVDIYLTTPKTKGEVTSGNQTEGT